MVMAPGSDPRDYEAKGQEAERRHEGERVKRSVERSDVFDPQDLRRPVSILDDGFMPSLLLSLPP